MRTSPDEFNDAEDRHLAASAEIWRMIEERRREPTVPLEELKAELLSDQKDQDEIT
jgi:hypothetical protein